MKRAMALEDMLDDMRSLIGEPLCDCGGPDCGLVITCADHQEAGVVVKLFPGPGVVGVYCRQCGMPLTPAPITIARRAS